MYYALFFLGTSNMSKQALNITGLTAYNGIVQYCLNLADYKKNSFSKILFLSRTYVDDIWI